MAAWKAPALVLEERGGIFWPWATDHELEGLAEQAASRERRDPAAEDDPLAPEREEESPPERQDDHRRERAEQADRVEDGVPNGGGPRMDPFEQRHVKHREWIMTDDVFGNAPEQPQPREADDEADRQVESQVLAAGEARGRERPRGGKARLESLDPGPAEAPLPDELGALDEPGTVPLEPAPPEHESDHQSDEQCGGEAGLPDVALELRQVAAECVAEGAEDHRPTHSAQGVVEHEGAVRHAGRPREHGGPGAQQRDEAAEEDGLGAVPLEEGVRALEMRLVESDEAPIASHQRDAAAAPDPVAAVVAEDGRGDGRRYHPVDREMSQ